MKEDYLWDKTGSDTEIEDLENSLKNFRSTNTTAPKLPQKTFAVDETSSQKKRPFWLSFQFVSASFACLAFTIFAIVAFQFINGGKQNLVQNDSNQTSDETFAEETVNNETKTVEDKPIVKETIQPTIEKARFTPKRKLKKRVVKAKKQIKKKIKPRKFIVKKIKPRAIEPKVKTVKLTKEEKEAYEQLMQALTITGSQMRIVQEKINGVEVNTDR